MSTEGMVVVAILAMVSLLALGMPFIAARRRTSEAALLREKARDELLTTYERVLATIRDLDEDFNTGKLAEDTYRQEREYWAERGVAILQQLGATPETIQQQQQPAVPRTAPERRGAEAELDDAIENAILAYRQAQ